MPDRLLATVALVAALLAGAPASAFASPPNNAARDLAVAAFAAHEAADYARAADLYFQAHQLDPADGAFLYASARSLHLGGQLALAIVRYRAFLLVEAANPNYRVRARAYLDEAEAQQRARSEQQRAAELAKAATPTQPTSVATIAPLQRPPPLSPLRTAGLWSGAAVGFGGALWLAAATWQRQTFETAMAPGFAGGKVDGYASRADAQARGHALTTQQNWAWAILSAGASAAIAAWLWPLGQRGAP